jgi:hypothetical protein
LCAATTILFLGEIFAAPAIARQINGTHPCRYGVGKMTISGFSQSRNPNPVVVWNGKKIIFGELNTGGTFRLFVSGDYELAVGRAINLLYQKKLLCSDTP